MFEDAIGREIPCARHDKGLERLPVHGVWHSHYRGVGDAWHSAEYILDLCRYDPMSGTANHFITMSNEVQIAVVVGSV